MARTLLVRGLLVGLAAGVVAFVVAWVFGEPAIDQAIAVEGAAHAGHSAGEAEPAMFSRTVQSTAGLLTATTVFGVALGGIFALAYGFAQGRVAGLGARGLSLTLALVGFVAVYALPFLKYPPNPPAVGDPDTIGRRTVLFFTMIAVSVLIAGLAVALGRRLQPAWGTWDAAIVAGVFFIVVGALAAWAMPTGQVDAGAFPAGTLYRFRIASFGIHLTLWTTLGLLFGALTERSLRARPRSRPAPVAS